MAGEDRRQGDGPDREQGALPETDAQARTVVADAGEEGGAASDRTVLDEQLRADRASRSAQPEQPPKTPPPTAGAADPDAPTRITGHVPPRATADTAARPAGAIEPGAVLFGEYEIEAVLGAGGMGEVYAARHRRLEEPRAIKVMHAELSGKKGANEFFLREAKALLAVRHPAVVHCHDLLSDDQGRIYLIMEMVEGVSLSDRIESQGALSPDEVLLLGARIAGGLDAAHACGVVHRDVSPDNIVLPGGDVSQAKLIDFGIAKLLEEGRGTIVDGFKGKLSYASPEQLGFFGGEIDGRSDFYSLGLVLCAAALGRPMGMGRTVVEAVDARRRLQHLPDDVPAGLRATLEPLLALDPAARPRFVERLFVAADGRTAESLGAVSSSGRREDRRGTPRWLAALAAAAVAGSVTAWWLLGLAPRPPAQPAPAHAPPTAAAVPAPVATTPVAPPEPVVPAAARPAAEPAPQATATPAAAPERRSLTALDRVRIVGLLRGAETALEENRLQSPKGNNAYEKYREVLEIDPDNREAQRGLVAVAGRYLALSEGASARGEVEQARTYLARAAAIAPEHPRLPEVRAALGE